MRGSVARLSSGGETTTGQTSVTDILEPGIGHQALASVSTGHRAISTGLAVQTVSDHTISGAGVVGGGGALPVDERPTLQGALRGNTVAAIFENGDSPFPHVTNHIVDA